MENGKKCGCKGIRTCLLCENKSKLSKSSEENKEVDQYLYCPRCNLCWPVGSDEEASPLFLGKLTVVPDFITEDEEAEITAAIDSIEWMPSQSGRKKQDFGPKVNFKKKKGKIGNFKGFPAFTEFLIKRLEQHKELSDFKPVELCHLDYDPGRGSAIEPHIDDSWIWGERLVTINLASPTILTFTPANPESSCDCLETWNIGPAKEKCCCYKVLDGRSNLIKQKDDFNSKICPGYSISDSITEKGHCKSKIPPSCSPEKPDGPGCYNNTGDVHTACDCCTQCIETSSMIKDSVKENEHCNHKVPARYSLNDQVDCLQTSLASNSVSDTFTACSSDTQCNKTQNNDPIKESRQCNCKVSAFLEKINSSTHSTSKDSKLCNHIETGEMRNYFNCPESNPIKDMCTEYRIGQKGGNVEVLVPLPPRSLAIVAGCCRHNWFHEIKRKDVVSRRLAMTFRELSRNFMAGGPDQDLGSELLELGKIFWEIKT